MRRPPDEFWFAHHRALGVEHFYLHSETEAETPSDVTLLVEKRAGYGYEFWTEQQRHVDLAIPRARDAGMTHLLHIDDDELLYLPGGRAAFETFLRETDASARTLVLSNVEAVAPHARVVSPFDECFFFQTDPTTFTAYANGKAIGVLRHADLRGSGAHRFRGQVEVGRDVALVLHYESMVVAAWRQKFERMHAQRALRRETADIPFAFYRDSMEAVASSPATAVETWCRYKLARPDQTLMHVHPSFVAPSILLVGNGPSLHGRDIGMYVDAFPVVVRFNEFVATPALGARTTVWCLSDHVAVTRPTLAREAERTLCVVATASPHARSDSEVRRAMRRRRNATIHRATRTSATTWPSTGILALEYFLTHHPTSPVFVCGFDHFATHPIHHYADDARSSHATTDEADAFERLARESGRVFRLPLDDRRPHTVDYAYPGLTVLHRDPDLLSIDGFLTPSECEALVERARPLLQDSVLVGNQASSLRTSRTAHMYEGAEDLLERVQRLTGMDASHMETPQVTYYRGADMYYKRHLDAPDESTPEGRAFCRRGGNRVVTVLVYLNDVSSGGETVFDFASVTPRQGRAVVFFPCTADGTRDLRLYHAASPTPDTKWVSQVWVRPRPHR